ncbi:MAG: N-carbamoyl-D-amino-acid hydrolase [Geminicoccaceae bacterium]|nr:N-carbamoyl-D-amino-acid hydrolase [Geminicoccaceae bacterium]MCS7268331.1 N-carbamoyl-D-amino-acid hydrolase [Geminicoccaceae bacterium]MDW8124618.1 N-carbamoyl-D-amino-acid hydrolase [Geminicoccaceae bacterium]MDW8341304.1 N-carbamoyl-D-amino-acid hydrolase [Geminicoccaceae bacterium]
MSRKFVVAAAQLGPIARNESRDRVISRLLALFHRAAACGARLVVFPELALTTFFPRWYFEREEELLAFFERSMPDTATRPLFEAAAARSCGFYLGYAELTPEGRRFNTAILVDERARIIGKYRKVHLPGHREHEPWRPFQHLEKRYFEPGDLGFPVFEAFGGKVGMLICNDRRWPEAWRVLGLQGVELVAVGYNTPQHYPPVPQHDHLQNFHNHLVLQAGAYQNGTWVVATAKCGVEEGCLLIGQSCIVAPTGEIVAMCTTLDDELALAEIDLDRTKEIKNHIFDFALHRRPECYGPICAIP